LNILKILKELSCIVLTNKFKIHFDISENEKLKWQKINLLKNIFKYFEKFLLFYEWENLFIIIDYLIKIVQYL
jgi:hypothetical protein